MQELTRHERCRRQTVAQIKAAAMAQVHQDGLKAVSLNAIACGMAMSPPLELDQHMVVTGVFPALLYRAGIETMLRSLCRRYNGPARAPVRCATGRNNTRSTLAFTRSVTLR
jgi:hypothetical protein